MRRSSVLGACTVWAMVGDDESAQARADYHTNGYWHYVGLLKYEEANHQLALSYASEAAMYIIAARSVHSPLVVHAYRSLAAKALLLAKRAESVSRAGASRFVCHVNVERAVL